MNVSELIKGQTLVTIEKTSSVKDAITLLHSKKIHCAPVLDAGDVVGLIDLGDLTAFLVGAFAKKAGYEGDLHCEAASNAIKNASYTQEDLEQLSEKYLAHPIIDLMDLSGRNKYTPIVKESPIPDTVAELKKGVHRLAVTDGDKPVGMITQSAVIKHISTKLEEEPYKAAASKKVGETPCKKSVVTVSTEVRAIDAFATLTQVNITAAPLVEEDGRFFANISLSDLFGCLESFKLLIGTAQDFVVHLKQQTVEKKTPAPAVHCNLDTTVAQCIAKLMATKQHRIYLVADQEKFSPCGVVSLGDLLQLMFA